MPHVGSDSSVPWISDVLARLGAKPNGDNDQALALWAESEGAPDWRHNWLNTSLSGYGGYSVNSSGVKAYPTYGDGVKATVATLKLGAYSGVVYALTSGLDLDVIYHAINASPWCHKCQGGHYPVILHDYLVGLGTFPGTTVVAGTRPPPPPTEPPGWDWSDKVKAAAAALNRHHGKISAYAAAIRR